MGGGSAVTLGEDVARTESMFTDGPWRPKGNEAIWRGTDGVQESSGQATLTDFVVTTASLPHI